VRTLAKPSIVDLFGDLVDRRTGIIREVQELLVDDDEPAFVHYLAYSSDTEAFGFLPNFGNNGGVGTSARSAIAKALGEGVERYCSALFRYEELIWASYAELAERATPPGDYALYSSAQYDEPGFPWRPFDDHAPVAWVRGRSLIDGATTLVPAAFVYVPYHYASDRPDTPIAQPISTGLACGSTLESATLSALCEVVERDAFTLAWQGLRSGPRIRNETLPADLADLVKRFAAVDLRVHLVDISTEVACPTILTVVEGFADTSPAVAVAAAAHPSPTVAARKSLEELAHTRKFAAQVMDYMAPVEVDVAGGHPAVDGQRMHLLFYGPQRSKRWAEFLWGGTEVVELGDVHTTAEPTLDALVAEVAATGEDVVAVDLTTVDVAELGLHVVRTVVPGFHPLHMGHANRALGGRRLATVLAGRDGDNPYPHPFP